MTIPKGLEHVCNINPKIMHGQICFAGTRVPLTIFLDNLKDGMGVDEFLVNYPSIQREHAEAVLEWESTAIRIAAGLQLAG